MRSATEPSRALRWVVHGIAGGVLLNGLSNLIEGADRILSADLLGLGYLSVGLVGLVVSYSLLQEGHPRFAGAVVPIAGIAYLAVTLAETALTSASFTTNSEYAGVFVVWVLLSLALLRYRTYSLGRQQATAG